MPFRWSPDVIGDPATVHLGQQSDGRRRALIADHRRFWAIQYGAVLRDDRLEELEAAIDAVQLERARQAGLRLILVTGRTVFELAYPSAA